MAQKKITSVRKGGRPRKLPDGAKWSEYNSTIAISKEKKAVLDSIRSDSEENYDDTICNLIEVMMKVAKEFLHMDNPKPQTVLDEIDKQLREIRKEDGVQ